MILAALLALAPSTEISLTSLNLNAMVQGYGKPMVNQSCDGHPLTIGGKVFATGVGTHARSVFRVNLGGHGDRFRAMVGVDSEANEEGSVNFRVIADGETLYASPVMHVKDSALNVDVDLKGRKVLTLLVEDGGDGINYDHADWALATISMFSGKPTVVIPPKEKAEILTPAPKPTPRLTGPQIFGVTPGNPFLFTVTATGDRPMTFGATGLPSGLQIDPASGRITGRVAQPGSYTATVTASNGKGKTSRAFKIVVGDKIALTPPMGWNSWNCWADSVSMDKVLRSARAMAAKLKDHGWSYVNIDDGWQGERGGEFGGIQGNKKFPDMAGMVKTIHAMGLKSGIYSTPWAQSYASYIGGSTFQADGKDDFGTDVNENHRYTGRKNFQRMGTYPKAVEDAKQYAAWGVDYLKYDWNPLDPEHVGAMTDALHASGRDIFYSLSNSADFKIADKFAALSNSWRTTGDINDSWGSVSSIWATQDRWHGAAGPGHWNDPDMLVVGRLGWGPALRPTNLTPNEQYTHISLWCLLSAPLLLGCDLENLDAFTLGLLTNDEVLDVDQDALGIQARQISNRNGLEVWAKPLADGSWAVGLFNQNDDPATVSVDWRNLALPANCRVRDLWRQKNLGSKSSGFSATVARHGVVLVQVFPPAHR